MNNTHFLNTVTLAISQIEETIDFQALNRDLIQQKIQIQEIYGIALFFQAPNEPKYMGLVNLVEGHGFSTKDDLYFIQSVDLSTELNALSTIGIDVFKDCGYYFSCESNRNHLYINLLQAYPNLKKNRILIPSM